VVIQPFPVIIICTPQVDDLHGQYLHGLFLFLNNRRQLANHVVMIFQGSPLGQHLTLQIADLPVIAVDFLILFQPFTTQLSTLSSFHFPLSSYNHSKH
jgi:hypothetical protein